MNTRSYFAILAGLLLFAYQLPGQVLVLPDDPGIKYTGRIDLSNPQKPAFGFSGVTINCKFSGTSIKVRFSSETTSNYYFYSIDESKPVKINLAKPTTNYLLSGSLADTLHRLTLVRLTEAFFGADYFEGIILDSGDSLAEFPESNGKLIEFYGNSITCGYGNEAPNPGEGFKAGQENFYYSYASDASRMLDAACIGICVSGIGMYRNYADPVTGSPDNMLTKYDRILYFNNNKKWDFTGYTPDVVCINLGTNDTSNGLFDAAIFTDSCRSLLMKLRSHYPEARIVYLTGPMMNATDTKKITDAVQGVFDEMNDPNLSLFHMSMQTGEYGYGGDYHPTIEQHWKNAMELAEYLKGLTGWATAPYFVSAAVAVDGKSLLVGASEPLINAIKVSGVQVLADGKPVGCESARLSGDDDQTFVIALSTRIREGQDVTVSYRNGEIRSLKQVRLLPFYGKLVSNPVMETQILSAAVHSEGNHISILFNKRITEVRPDSFSLIVDGEVLTSLSTVAFTKIDREVVMTFDDKISDDQTIYLKLHSGAVTGSDGIVNEDINNFPVTNNSLITGSRRYKSSDAFVVFPNPSGDRFTLSGGKTVSINRIELYDGNGRLVTRYTVNPQGSYDMTGLADGIYFCRIWLKKEQRQSVTLKIIKR